MFGRVVPETFISDWLFLVAVYESPSGGVDPLGTRAPASPRQQYIISNLLGPV